MRAREQVVEVSPEALRFLERALKRQWQRYRKELQRCQEQFSEKSVHESRVAARRLLSTIELLEGFLKLARVKKVRRCLKQHLDTFDDLRDTQVQSRAAKLLRRSLPLGRSFYEWLLSREERFRKQARAGVKRIRPKALRYSCARWTNFSARRTLGPSLAASCAGKCCRSDNC